jgi:hypothetical protein
MAGRLGDVIVHGVFINYALLCYTSFCRLWLTSPSLYHRLLQRRLHVVPDEIHGPSHFLMVPVLLVLLDVINDDNIYLRFYRPVSPPNI